MTEPSTPSTFDATMLERPDPKLFRYYVLVALLTGPMSPIVLIPLWFRYATLRYKFEDSGVSMQWGVLFRREVYLTYRRIQDIQLTRNLLQRWMGLAKISLQTASGSSQAEMAIEGILQAEELRDFLYSRMRGAKNQLDVQPIANQFADLAKDQVVPVAHTISAATTAGGDAERATRALEDIRDALKTLVEQRGAL